MKQEILCQLKKLPNIRSVIAEFKDNEFVASCYIDEQSRRIVGAPKHFTNELLFLERALHPMNNKIKNNRTK